MIEWWAYRHTNGSIQVKRFLDWESIDEAHSSPFVVEVHGPYAAEGREEAVAIAQEYFR